MTNILVWLESTPAGMFARESLYGFQMLAAIHILGLTVSVGTLFWFDLRLLGVSMVRCPISEVYRRLMPWMLSGFAVMLTSGGLLFTGFATKAAGSVYFRLKVLALVCAAVNALFFHRVTERTIVQWDKDLRPPLPARLAGLISIVLWAVVIVAGRLMSYTMF